MNTMNILAADVNNVEDFFNKSTIGGMIGTLLIFVGSVFVIFSLVGAFKLFASGKTSDAVKKILVALLIGVICFNPSIISTPITALQGLIETLFGSGGDVETIIG